MLVGLELRTGRRHQARVHLAWLGFPVVGDARYGSIGEPPMLLHALGLDLSAVFPDEKPVVAPPPAPFTAAMPTLNTGVP